MSQVATVPEATGRTGTLAISGVVNHRSIGVGRYARLLAAALADEDIAYRLVERRDPVRPAHVHLANSSRSLLRQSRRPRAAFVVTVHDVVPRTRALAPAYRALAYPQVTRLAAAAVVHTAWAADMLVHAAGRPRRLEVIPHPVPAAARDGGPRSRPDVRSAWPDDRLIAVIPGVIKDVKLVAEALTAGAEVARLARRARRPARRPGLAREAQMRGALVLPEPDDLDVRARRRRRRLRHVPEIRFRGRDERAAARRARRRPCRDRDEDRLDPRGRRERRAVLRRDGRLAAGEPFRTRRLGDTRGDGLEAAARGASSDVAGFGRGARGAIPRGARWLRCRPS